VNQLTAQLTDLITFTDASKILHVSRPTVYNLLKHGTLNATTIGRNRYVSRQEVETLERQRHQDGQHKKT